MYRGGVDFLTNRGWVLWSLLVLALALEQLATSDLTKSLLSLYIGFSFVIVTFLLNELVRSRIFVLLFGPLAIISIASFLYSPVTLIITLLVLIAVVAVIAFDFMAGSQGLAETPLAYGQLLSIINAIGDGVIATNNEGRIQLYNGAALSLLNTNQTLHNKLFSEVCTITDEKGKQVDIISKARKIIGSSVRTDLKLRYGAKDFANIYLHISPVVVGFGQDAQKGFTLIMRDISKEKSLDEERDEFISTVSHELRTPVTITEGKLSNAKLLLERKSTKKKQIVDAIDTAHDQTIFLASMINDLASLARAERDEDKMPVGPINLDELLDKIDLQYSPQAMLKGLSFKIHRPKNKRITFNSNELYVKEIIQNLVSNAIKYTEKGQILVAAEKISDGGVEIRVVDSGIGISTSDQKKIFTKFFRSEDYRTRQNNGTGLGLYVVAKLANKLRAKISVISVLDKGSTFKLVVPSLDLPGRVENS